MGKQLAMMHKHTNPQNQYGYHEDNFIGETPQINTWKDTWADFFVECRLRPQIDLFIQNGNILKEKDQLLETVHTILSTHNPSPSLLHGDLWGGNAAFISPSTPVLYDPACYYGDRETDIVMTKVCFEPEVNTSPLALSQSHFMMGIMMNGLFLLIGIRGFVFMTYITFSTMQICLEGDMKVKCTIL